MLFFCELYMIGVDGRLAGRIPGSVHSQMVRWALSAYLGKNPSVVHGIILILFHHRGPQDTPFFDEQPLSPPVHVPLKMGKKHT